LDFHRFLIPYITGFVDGKSFFAMLSEKQPN
jgi:hypothetical protein